MIFCKVNPATLDSVARLCRICGTPNPVIFRSDITKQKKTKKYVNTIEQKIKKYVNATERKNQKWKFHWVLSDQDTRQSWACNQVTSRFAIKDDDNLWNYKDEENYDHDDDCGGKFKMRNKKMIQKGWKPFLVWNLTWRRIRRRASLVLSAGDDDHYYYYDWGGDGDHDHCHCCGGERMVSWRHIIVVKWQR